jgi:hypothetical protein
MKKICPKCKGLPQPLKNFHKDLRRRDGHFTACKVCEIKRVQKSTKKRALFKKPFTINELF